MACNPEWPIRRRFQGGIDLRKAPWLNSDAESSSSRPARSLPRRALPAMYQYREFTAAGGLMSYAGSIADAYRVAGVYAGRVLRGEKPSELPVQQSTKAELFVNLGTAKALGIVIPQSILIRADEVIP